MRKTTILILFLLLHSLSSMAAPTDVYNIIPLPKTININGEGSFALNGKIQIAYADKSADMQRNANMLADYIKSQTGWNWQVNNKGKGNVILAIDKTMPTDEGYEINVAPAAITIKGKSAAAVFYGIQALRKIIATGDVTTLPCATIADQPRFSYRGTHFDTSRHYFPTAFLKTYIDILALHGINKFHWHITDDQGWRFEVKKRPLLTEIGSRRDGTMKGHDWSSDDHIPHGGYYTQDECREIVKYAADRYITIIPEIDMPGHMQGALAAYPNLGCTGGPYKVWKQWGVSTEVLCAGNPEVVTFLHDVLDELCDVFPSTFIHLGGDECPKDRWKECPKCQQKAKELGLKAENGRSVEAQLQTYLLCDAEAYLAKKGRQVIGWEEILEGGLGPNTTVMSWLGQESGEEAAKMGHDVIMTPLGHCYFDYCQSKDWDNEPVAFQNALTMQQVYAHEPVPAGLTPEEAKHILGAQANLWTEYVATGDHAEYMLLPRLAALSEVQWIDAARKDYDSYLRRLPRLQQLYSKLGYFYRNK